jgi:hypothetical protein
LYFFYFFQGYWLKFCLAAYRYSPHLFRPLASLYIQTWFFEAEPDPEAGLPIPSSSASSANPQATTKSNLVRLSEE